MKNNAGILKPRSLPSNGRLGFMPYLFSRAIWLGGIKLAHQPLVDGESHLSVGPSIPYGVIFGLNYGVYPIFGPLGLGLALTGLDLRLI